MKVYVAGTPLEALLWQRRLDRVKIVFRPGTDPETKRLFLADLKRSIEEHENAN